MMHALLRLALLGFNILDTFKTLKVKVRPGYAAPSTKAMLQRKREMKGVLCLWVVCMSFFICESIGDRTVGYVTPFYGQMKTLVLFFLLVARTAGAEFIVLHVIKPFIKPYTRIIDSLLDFLYVLVTFAVEIGLLPWNSLMARWDEFNAAKEPITILQIPTGDDGGLAITSTEVTPIQTRNPSRLDIPVQDLPIGYNAATATANGYATRSQTRWTNENPSQIPTIRNQRSARSLGSEGQHTNDRDLPSNAELDDEAVMMQTKKRRDLDLRQAAKQTRGIMNGIARAQNDVREATEARRRLQARSAERINTNGRSRFGTGQDDRPGYASSSSSVRRQETVSNPGTIRSTETIQPSRYGQRAMQSSKPRTMPPPESLPTKSRPASDSGSSRGPFISYVPAPPAGSLEYSNSIALAETRSEHSSDDMSEAQSQPTISYLEAETPPPRHLALETTNPFMTPGTKSQASSAPPAVASGSALPNDPLNSAHTSTFTTFEATLPIQSSSHTSTSLPTGFDVSQLDVDRYFSKFNTIPGGFRESVGTDHWEGLTQLSLINKSPHVPQPQPLFSLLDSANGGSVVSSEPPEVPPKDNIPLRPTPRPSSPIQNQEPARSHSAPSSVIEPQSPSLFPPPTPPSQYLHDGDLPEVESPYLRSVPQPVVELPDESASFRQTNAGSRFLASRDLISPGPMAPGGFQWTFQPLQPPPLSPLENGHIPESRRTTVQDFDELKRQHAAGMLNSPRIDVPGDFPMTPAAMKTPSPLTPDSALLGAPPNVPSPRKKKAAKPTEPKDLLRNRMVDITSTLVSRNDVSLPVEDDEDEEEWRNSQRISIFDPLPGDAGEFGENDTFRTMKSGLAVEVSKGRKDDSSTNLPPLGSPPNRWLTDAIDSAFSIQTKSSITLPQHHEESAQPQISPTARDHRFQATAISAAMMMEGSPPTQAILRPTARNRGAGSGSNHSRSSRDALYLEDKAHPVAEALSPTLADPTLREIGTRSVKSRPPPIMTDQSTSGKRGEAIVVSGSSSHSARYRNGKEPLTRNGSVSGRSDAASSHGSEKNLSVRLRSSKRALRQDQNRHDTPEDGDNDSQSDTASVTKKRKVSQHRVPASANPSTSYPASQLPSYSRSGSSSHRSRSSKEATAPPPPAPIPPPLPARRNRILPENGEVQISSAKLYPTIDSADGRSPMNDEPVSSEPRKTKSKRHRK